MRQTSTPASSESPASKVSQRPKIRGTDRFKFGGGWALGLLLIAALLVRVIYLRSHVVVLEGEGAGYAHQADNLLRGRGFESFLYPKPDLEHCWLQPILIAGVDLVVRDLDVATHIVSLVAGTLLVFWLFLISDRFYGRTVATVAALLVAFHPFLIALSTTGYAEILAAALEFGAIYWSIRLIEDHGRWCWLYAGVCWGLSYLNRTECLVLPLFTVGVFLLHTLWQKWPLRRWLTRSAAFITVFALFVAPYVMLFYHYTGKVRFEGKNLLNYTIGQRKLDGKPQPLASRELTPDLRELGPSLDTGAYTTYSPYPTGFRDLARYYARAARNNAPWLWNELLHADYFGGAPLIALALLGLVGRYWDQARFFRELYLGGIFLYFVFVVLGTHLQWRRYLFSLLPFLLLWSAVGIVYLVDWIRRSAQELRVPLRIGTKIAAAFALVYVLFIFYTVKKTIPTMDEFTSGWAPNQALKEAGLWLRNYDPGTKTTFEGDVFCYYSRSYDSILPYTDEGTALRYLHEKDPDYIFLYSANADSAYYSRWVQQGIPDPSAIAIYNRTLSDGRRLVIYRWDHASSRN